MHETSDLLARWVAWYETAVFDMDVAPPIEETRALLRNKDIRPNNTLPRRASAREVSRDVSGTGSVVRVQFGRR